MPKTTVNLEEVSAEELFAIAERFLEGGWDVLSDEESDFIFQKKFEGSEQIIHESPVKLILFLFRHAHNPLLKSFFHACNNQSVWIYNGIRHTCAGWNSSQKLDLIEEALSNINPESDIDDDKILTELFVELKPYMGLEETDVVHTIKALCKLQNDDLCRHPHTSKTIKRLCRLLRKEIAEQGSH